MCSQINWASTVPPRDWRDCGGMLLRCLEKAKTDMITTYLHGGACGGHRYWKSIAFNILRENYYWPSLFFDVYSKASACLEFQKFLGKQKILYLPLKPIVVDGPFQ